MKHDFCVDNNALGDNLAQAAAAGYTLSRRICPVRTSTLLSVSGIIPMKFDTTTKRIVYSGLDSSRITVAGLSSGTSTSVPLIDTNGFGLAPVDLINGIADGGRFQLDAKSSDVTVLTMWQQGYFGTTHYAGIGGDRYYPNNLDIQTFDVEVPTSVLQMYSTNLTVITSIARSMTYDTRQLP